MHTPITGLINHRARAALAAGAAAALLAACGGGSSETAAPVADDGPGAVPASATASPAAFTAYVAGLPADDRREPVAVEGVVPPTSETAEPAAVVR